MKNKQDHHKQDHQTGSLQETSTTNTEVHQSLNHGTTNANIEGHKQKEAEGYQIAIEDTMISYDGKDDQIDSDLGDKDKRRSGKTGTGDND